MGNLNKGRFSPSTTSGQRILLFSPLSPKHIQQQQAPWAKLMEQHAPILTARFKNPETKQSVSIAVFIYTITSWDAMSKLLKVTAKSNSCLCLLQKMAQSRICCCTTRIKARLWWSWFILGQWWFWGSAKWASSTITKAWGSTGKGNERKTSESCHAEQLSARHCAGTPKVCQDSLPLLVQKFFGPKANQPPK